MLYIAQRLVFVILIFLWGCDQDQPQEERYWIWSGLTTNHAPPQAYLYIYQGAWIHDTFIHKGIYPFPAVQKRVCLTYRLEGSLPDPQKVVHLFLTHQQQWQKHGVIIDKLQLDYDSPSKDLAAYLAFLTHVKSHLPLAIELSITGLCDWLVQGDSGTLNQIGHLTHEIIFQLYHHHHYIHPLKPYLRQLKKIKFPYRLGILAHISPQENIDALKSNSYYGGLVIFIQK